MHVIRLHTKCIFFLASLTLSYCRHISFGVEDMKRILSRKESCDGVCMTPECVKTAARIISSLDESVDPCSNFYRFACGGWLNSHVIPKGKELVSVDSTIADDINMKLNALIEKKLDGTEPASVKMLKDMYDACMDLETIDKLGGEPLKKDLAILGGWPVVEGSKWNESNFDWIESLIAFRRLGYDFNTLIKLSVQEDERNSTTNIIKLRLPYLKEEILTRGLNDSILADDYKWAVKVSLLLGADVNIAEKELLEAVQFQIELAKISVPEEDDENKIDENDDKRDISRMHQGYAADARKDKIHERKIKRREKRDVSGMYSKYTVAELQEMIPQIPWLRYFNGLLNDEIGETENVVVSDPVYLQKLGKLLEKTEKRVVANYMFWRLVLSSMHGLLSEKWWKSEYERQNKSRHERCFRGVLNELTIALNTYYVRNYFKEDSQHAVMELVKYIHREYLRILEGADWMDDATRKEAIEKANSMKTMIGYPNELLNDTLIMEFYKNFTISNSSFYRNELNSAKWQTDTQFSSLRKPSNEETWVQQAIESVTVNAFQFNEDNSIEFPAGYLQNLLFEKDRPRYMNFGSIGSVIGHEITHGFDVKGKQYDKDGNEVDWWDKTTDELYHKRVQCIIEQYSNYTAENGMKLNGEKTKNDDIADLAGLKAAYLAYHSWVANNGREPLLPGIKYNQDQLFWISAAHRYCGKEEPEHQRWCILNDEHSPREYRVIGPMSNLPEFSRDFNCPSGSPMNRKNKCHIW